MGQAEFILWSRFYARAAQRKQLEAGMAGQ
jgi:hypothetical protein